MGMFKEAIDTLKAVLLLQDEIKRMSTNLSRLAEKSDDMQQRIIKLESREDAIVSRAQAAAQMASGSLVSSEIGGLRERLAKIEVYLAAISVGRANVVEGNHILLQTKDSEKPKDN